jgi:hypothetical protein
MFDSIDRIAVKENHNKTNGVEKMAITITVNKSFGEGEKQINLDDYVDAFTWGLNSISNLASNMEEIEELENMRKRVKELAVKKFFELYQKEQQS